MEFGVPVGLIDASFRVLLGGSWDVVTTYNLAYKITYSLSN